MLDLLLTSIERRQATVAIFGLGYVGLPLATLFVKAGFRVLGFDVNEDYVAKLAGGVSCVLDVPDDQIQACLATGRFHVTSDVEVLRPALIHIICVPTPLSKSRQPDMGCITSALDLLTRIWAPGRMAILESTTYPGTTDELLLPVLAQSGMTLDEHFFLVLILTAHSAFPYDLLREHLDKVLDTRNALPRALDLPVEGGDGREGAA